jgi:hypothetical protein
MLMTRAPCPTAQSIPLRMLNVVLSALAALLEKACTASRRAAGAVPSTLARGHRARHAGAVGVRAFPVRRPPR